VSVCFHHLFLLVWSGHSTKISWHHRNLTRSRPPLFSRISIFPPQQQPQTATTLFLFLSNRWAQHKKSPIFFFLGKNFFFDFLKQRFLHLLSCLYMCNCGVDGTIVRGIFSAELAFSFFICFFFLSFPRMLLDMHFFSFFWV